MKKLLILLLFPVQVFAQTIGANQIKHDATLTGNGLNQLSVVGSVGSTGPTGATGLNGATGAVGITGATGGAGTNGSTGATGVAGSNGTNGATGPTGSNGTNGSTGPTGLTGPTGTATQTLAQTLALGNLTNELVIRSNNSKAVIRALNAYLQLDYTNGANSSALYMDDLVNGATYNDASFSCQWQLASGSFSAQASDGTIVSSITTDVNSSNLSYNDGVGNVGASTINSSSNSIYHTGLVVFDAPVLNIQQPPAYANTSDTTIFGAIFRNKFTGDLVQGGVIGMTGATGATGTVGATGATGSTGNNGTNGATGATGSITSLTDSHILVGNGSNVPTDVAMSGVTSISNTGVVSFGSFSSSTLATALTDEEGTGAAVFHTFVPTLEVMTGSLAVFSPSDGAVTYIGESTPLTPNATATNRQFQLPTGTIRAVYLYVDPTGAVGTNESVAYGLRNITDATSTALGTITYDVRGNATYTNGLSVSVTAGKFYSIEITNPTYTTNPSNCYTTCKLIIYGN